MASKAAYEAFVLRKRMLFQHPRKKNAWGPPYRKAH
jgi:hypothetical protein